MPRGSIGISQLSNARVAGSKRETSPDEKPGIHSRPFESKRSRRGAVKGVSTISTSSVSGSMRPILCAFSWLNQTSPFGAMSMP